MFLPLVIAELSINLEAVSVSIDAREYLRAGWGRVVDLSAA